MEKRNFVTSLRTSCESGDTDAMVDRAADMFDDKGGLQKKSESDMAKKASAEDEKTDSLS